MKRILPFLILLLGPQPWSFAGGLELKSPLDYQVVQRTSFNKGVIKIAGGITGVSVKDPIFEAKLLTGTQDPPWRKLQTTVALNEFETSLEAPAGGWYRLEVRALAKDKIVAQATVEHVGIGELFVVAGQSNSANHGEERQTPKTGRVVAWDGSRWQLANDPQPGASGDGGSFLPAFGDALAAKFDVPVGFIACGIGATSVREWLPKGATFPNPPTIESRVTKLSDGNWESKGAAFASFVQRMKPLGPQGFRAVLWHQGESDANQKDPTRTLPGPLYREYLAKLINESRREIGWEAPWFVAQASYHIPGDESSPDIRAAQASLWKDGNALEGPDTDALKGDFRERNGQGVHFSAKGLQEHGARWAARVIPWLEGQKLK